MKILSKKIIKGVGFIKVVPEEDDDFWHLYNLLSVGDIIKTSTHRKIVKESQTGTKVSEKRRIYVFLKVHEINYWADQYLLLSIKGRNCQESHWLSLGQFHTYEVELNQKIVIYKENWDRFHYAILDQIKQQQTLSEVAALIMEEGVGHLCLIGSATTRLKQKVEKQITKKRSANEQREKAMEEFFKACLAALEQDSLFEQVKCLIVASPGYVKDDFYQFLRNTFQKEEKYKGKQKMLEKIFLVRSSSGYLNSLMEILQDQQVQQRLENTKAMQEVMILEKFFEQLRLDITKVAYGKKDVEFAHSLGAIQTLLISDKVARAKDPKVRRQWLKVIEEIKNKGGEVFIFSSLHPSGKQLNNYTGIAAILYVSVQFDYEDDDEEEEQEEQVGQQIHQHQQQHQHAQDEFKMDVVVQKKFEEFGMEDGDDVDDDI
ncbi:unnamed protein product [Paramecium octaurelia]|uniref:Protein pelota homolog n=1 Tax=Paramecium octaurelia TaxID=43137 RepID=A0A8S1UR47_PAROT|nr:unnamed protein product [Paramecium octaurelia]